MPRLLAIATRPKKRAPMEECVSAAVTFENGVGSDSRGKFRNHRQVTVLTKEGWDAACTEMGKELPWTTRRANLFIVGIDLQGTTGKHLQIGRLKLEITGELEPCNRMDEQFQGLTNALKADWRGGVTCRIVEEGQVKVSDPVQLLL
ncbi:MAG: MOSC domain-containing protein [Flavobacteriales bacterium]|nr:MOSC domain-containing protein [Flavobacteriales bacterium]